MKVFFVLTALAASTVGASAQSDGRQNCWKSDQTPKKLTITCVVDTKPQHQALEKTQCYDDMVSNTRAGRRPLSCAGSYGIAVQKKIITSYIED